LMKKYNFSINLDLIYCLPWDNLESFKKSLEFVYLLKSDQINIYKYENSKSTDLYKDWFNKFWDDHIDNLYESKKIIYNFFDKKEWVVTEAIESYWGGDYRIISYFKDKNNIDYNDRRQTSSILDLGYWEISYILWEMEYEIFPTEKLNNLDLVIEEEILNCNTWDFYGLKHSALKYFLIRFTSNINNERFKEIFKIEIFDILLFEINLLNKLWKIKIDDTKENIVFNFINQDDLILYQRFIYNLHLKKWKK
jgi:hypothetical protein